MKDFSFVLFIVLLVAAFIIGYRFGRSPKQVVTRIVRDTVTVTQAQPIYYTKTVTRIDTANIIDTIYVASLDTTIDDIQVKVEYESPTQTFGTFNLSAISTRTIFVPPDYYIQTIGYNSFITPLRTFTFSAGKYLISDARIKLGIGGYLVYYNSNPFNQQTIDYGLQANFLYEF